MAFCKVLAFVAMVCMTSVAHGSLFAVDEVPEAVGQQRSLLATTATPAYYTARNQRISARVALFIVAPKGKTLSFNIGASTLVKRIRAVQASYNKTYKASNNFSVKYVSGPRTIRTRAWVFFTVAVDVGPPGAAYKARLIRALKAAIKRRSVYVRNVRGNLP